MSKFTRYKNWNYVYILSGLFIMVIAILFIFHPIHLYLYHSVSVQRLWSMFIKAIWLLILDPSLNNRTLIFFIRVIGTLFISIRFFFRTHIIIYQVHNASMFCDTWSKLLTWLSVIYISCKYIYICV